MALGKIVQKHACWLVLCIVLNAPAERTALATSKASPEAAALSNIQAAFKLLKSHYGRFPTNWSEVDIGVDLRKLNEMLMNKPEAFPLERHYLFVPEEFNLFDGDSRRILLLRLEPLTRETGDPGRHVLVAEGENCIRIWMPESDVQKALAKASGPLPSPDLKSAEAAELAVKQKIEERRAWERKAELEAFKFTLLDKLSSIKSWFISPAGTGSPSGRIKVLPVSFVIVALAGVGVLVYRVWTRR